MKRPTAHQLDAYLQRVVETVREMRALDVATDDAHHRALEASRQVQAVLAMYRHQLKHLQPEDRDAVEAGGAVASQPAWHRSA